MAKRLKLTAQERLGRRIRAARGCVGLRQADAAASAGIRQSNWSDYEAGKTEITVGVLRRVAAAIGTTPAELLEE